MVLLTTWTEWLALGDPNVRLVLAGTVMAGITAATVGSFAYLRKRSLVGDAVAHAVLPGICLAFMLGQNRSLGVLLPGAFASGLLALWSMDLITSRSRIKPDGAIAVVLSVFFGAGVLLLTHIQQRGSASQAGLQDFLFGQAAGMLPSDVQIIAATGALVCLAVGLLFKELTLLSFDPSFARARGLPVRSLEGLLAVLTVLAVVVGVQTVGVVLIAALLVTPALTARFWTDNLPRMVLLAAAFAALAGVLGSVVSYRMTNMPTGPWIIVWLSALAFLSLLLAPRRGVLARRARVLRHRYKMLKENILKTVYHAGEERGDFEAPVDREALLSRRDFPPFLLRLTLWLLRRQGLLRRKAGGYTLSEAGRVQGARLARLHRLWELYLTRYLRLAPDHVHEDAEAMEHLITPEIEAQLEEALNFPRRDPHDRAIPR